VALVASSLILELFGALYYAPFYVAIIVALVIFRWRSRSLRRKVPPPYGEGTEEVISARAATRMGLLMIAGGVLLLVVPLASVFFVSVVFLFTLYLALGLGIGLAEILQFAWVTRLEARAGMEIYSIAEETQVEGQDAIIKRAALTPTGRAKGDDDDPPHQAIST
jgi:hypothetical protein